MVCDIQAHKATTVGLAILNAIYSEIVYFSLVNDVRFITVNLQLSKILV